MISLLFLRKLKTKRFNCCHLWDEARVLILRPLLLCSLLVEKGILLLWQWDFHDSVCVLPSCVVCGIGFYQQQEKDAQTSDADLKRL